MSTYVHGTLVAFRFDQMSGEANAKNWTIEALRLSDCWKEVRELATTAVRLGAEDFLQGFSQLLPIRFFQSAQFSPDEALLNGKGASTTSPNS